MRVHCFFEQSGIFKNEFKKLGYEAFDYDILNSFSETDYIVDLFIEIEKAYVGMPSLFDSITKNDLIFAFFPCIRFSAQFILNMQCLPPNLNSLPDIDKLNKVMYYHNHLNLLYTVFCKLCYICIQRDIKLIIENPYSPNHYLTRYFPIKPKLIDFNRSLRGDDFIKPTQYWFINFEPKNNFVAEAYFVGGDKRINKVYNRVERSLINPNYAERFIKEFIL